MRTIILTLLAVTLLVAAVAKPATALDVATVTISHDKDYHANVVVTDPYGVSLLVRGIGITSISAVDPHSVGHVLSDQGNGMWYFAEHAAFADLTALDASYGPGDYVFTFNAGELDEDTVTINYVYTELIGFANITYPADGQTNVPLNPVYTWNSVAGYADADGLLMAVMEYPNVSTTYNNWPGSDDLTPTSWQPGPLTPFTEYEFGISVSSGQGDLPTPMQTDTFDDAFDYVGSFGNWNSVTFETGPAISGDVDGNGYVSGPDLTTIITNWGITGATRAQGDLSGDGTVSGPDYTEVITYWGTGTPPPEPGAIPEPATLGLLLLASLTLLRRRRSLITRNTHIL